MYGKHLLGVGQFVEHYWFDKSLVSVVIIMYLLNQNDIWPMIDFSDYYEVFTSSYYNDISQIAKTLWSMSIRYRSDTFNQIDIDQMVFAIWDLQ